MADGVADAEGIDTAMKLGANHPMGPLALGDLVGLDVCLAIMEVLYRRIRRSEIQTSSAAQKNGSCQQAGRKTGVGFYDYSK